MKLHTIMFCKRCGSTHIIDVRGRASEWILGEHIDTIDDCIDIHCYTCGNWDLGMALIPADTLNAVSWVLRELQRLIDRGDEDAGRLMIKLLTELEKRRWEDIKDEIAAELIALEIST